MILMKFHLFFTYNYPFKSVQCVQYVQTVCNILILLRFLVDGLLTVKTSNPYSPSAAPWLALMARLNVINALTGINYAVVVVVVNGTVRLCQP